MYGERDVLLFCPKFLSDSAIPWTVACQASLSFMISWGLLKFMSIESVMLSNDLILCYPLVLPSSFPSISSFPMSQFFAPGGHSIGASASFLPVNFQDWFPSILMLDGITDSMGMSLSNLQELVMDVFTYMQSTSWEMLGWKKHKLESRLPGEISITSDMQMTPPLWHKVKKN